MAAETETRNLLLDWLDAYVVGDSGLVECAHATVEYLRGETPSPGHAQDELQRAYGAIAALSEKVGTLGEDLAAERAHVRTLQQALEEAQARPGTNGTGHAPATDLTHAVVQTVEGEPAEEPAERPETRICKRCERELPLADAFASNDVGGRKWTCRDCYADLPPAERTCETEGCEKPALYGSRYCSISHAQLAVAARKRFTDEPDADGLVQCRVCQTRKPASEFYPGSLRRHRCKAGDKGAKGKPEERAARLATVTERRCRKCQAVKPIGEFHQDGAGGRKHTCRTCENGHGTCADCGADIGGQATRCKSCAGKEAAARRTQRNQPAHDPAPVALVPEVAPNHVTTRKPAPTPTRQDRLAACVAALRETAGAITQELMGALSVDHGLPVCDVRAAVDQVLAERKGERRCTECNAAFRPATTEQARCGPCDRIAKDVERATARSVAELAEAASAAA